MTRFYDGFWVPGKLREVLFQTKTSWSVTHFRNGKRVSEPGPETVSIRLPDLSGAQWETICRELEAPREKACDPDKLTSAIKEAGRRLNDPNDPLGRIAEEALPAITGLSPGMIDAVLRGLDQLSTKGLKPMLRQKMPAAIRAHYVAMDPEDENRGLTRFYESGRGGQVHRWFPTVFAQQDRTLPLEPDRPSRILALLSGIALGKMRRLAVMVHVVTMIHPDGEDRDPGSRPYLLVNNSLDEPLTAALFLTALEEIEPEVVENIALLSWERDRGEPPAPIMDRADLIIAADVPEKNREIETRYREKPKPRIHLHDHKVAFSVIAIDYLKRFLTTNESEARKTIHRITRLAALDAILWDQQGDRASRVHFVERGIGENYTPLEYSRLLAEKIRELSMILPRGAISMRQVHERFEKYNEMGPDVHACSHFEDDFVVVLDERPWQSEIFASVLDDCRDRTIVVRPVDDIMAVPNKYMQGIEPDRLQTVSTAIDGASHKTWSKRFTRFADAMGARGITRICTLGRAAFPEVSTSWDGFLPLDYSFRRAPGYFTTINFENTYDRILKTHALFRQILEASGQRYGQES